MVSIPLVVIVFSTLVWCGMVQPSSMLETRQGQEIVITRLKDATKGGHGYRLRYTVPVALHTYWNFKTDFDSDYLLTNRYITHHEFIAREQNRVITQNAYSYRPRVWFRWRTTVHSDALRLDFHLLNPEECGQKFHYGFIQVEGLGDRTRVTQVAYFDFFGASIWSHFPGMGGMHDMLQYMARWEQRITQKLESRYASPRGKTVRP
jgi:hypothetical protein